jgi:transposase InsO family protein
LAQYGNPEVFNTDQGCQFTSEDFTSVLKQAGVQISMDGKGRLILPRENGHLQGAIVDEVCCSN